MNKNIRISHHYSDYCIFHKKEKALFSFERCWHTEEVNDNLDKQLFGSLFNYLLEELMFLKSQAFLEVLNCMKIEKLHVKRPC